jgi:hypothetical protein
MISPNPWLQNNFGASYLALGQVTRAIERYQHTIKMGITERCSREMSTLTQLWPDWYRRRN